MFPALLSDFWLHFLSLVIYSFIHLKVHVLRTGNTKVTHTRMFSTLRSSPTSGQNLSQHSEVNYTHTHTHTHTHNSNFVSSDYTQLCSSALSTRSEIGIAE